MNNMHIVIAGGSGFLGQELARLWVGSNRVTILTRNTGGVVNNAYGSAQRVAGVDYIQWDGVLKPNYCLKAGRWYLPGCSSKATHSATKSWRLRLKTFCVVEDGLLLETRRIGSASFRFNGILFAFFAVVLVIIILLCCLTGFLLFLFFTLLTTIITTE